MSLTETLKAKAEEAARRALSENLPLIQIESEGQLVLVKTGTAEARDREGQAGAIAETFEFAGVNFYVCNW